MTIEMTELSVQEIHERLSAPGSAVAMHRDAIKRGMPLGRYLEALNPSDKDDRLDAFGRQLRAAGIVARSDPKAGYWASEGKEFWDTTAGRALYPEFFARQWRSVMYADRQQRAILLSGDSLVGGWDKPYFDAMTPRWEDMVAPAIPLSELIAFTTPITGEDYRALYLNYDAEQLRKFRVGESAEIPIATITTSERSIRLKKYGRGLRASYEQLRRLRVDKLAWFIRFAAIQSEVDKVSAALDVLINGDGNTGTEATEFDLTDLHAGATAGTLSLEGWLAFKMKFAQPYQITTALMREDVALQLALLNTGSANIPLSGTNLGGLGTGVTPINTFADGVRYGWTAEAPDNKIVGFDRRFALEYVTEIGGDITETERYITNQTEVMVMSEVDGFAIFDSAATKILDLETE
jgi:hypothetical protein